MNVPATGSGIPILTRIFAWATRIGFALLPAVAIAYLHFFSDPAQRFSHHASHEAAIALAVTLSAFVSFVTWRCYRESGEPFLYWLAQGLTGFTVVYLLHGALTRTADHNAWFFLIFGPASRVVMNACLFIGLLRFGMAPDPLEVRHSTKPFWRGMTIFLSLDVVILAMGSLQGVHAQWFRLIAEACSIVLTLACLAVMLRRRISSPLMNLYLLAIAFSAQASLAFLLAKPWNHMWWLAHMISAGGFFALSYGIVEAFHTTRAFSTVYSQEEMMRRLEHANRELERLAATDALTGAANRRHFMLRASEELTRSERSGEPFSILMMDIDHFKNVNDTHGHAAGDATLVAFAARTRDMLRAHDLFGRFGGEEFIVLLPGSGAGQAIGVAERIRSAMEHEPIAGPAGELRVTVSIGIAEYGSDGDSVDALISAADDRLYRAKEGGRNRVVWVPFGDGLNFAAERLAAAQRMQEAQGGRC